MKITLGDTLRSLLPSDTETLLLRACLCRGDAGNDAWQGWQDRVGDLKREFASKRPILSHLLPLLHEATRSYGARMHTEVAFLLRAAAFREELRAQTFRRILTSTLLALREANVYPVVLEGAALAATVYASWSLRHCHDIDLWVDPDSVRRAGQAVQDAFPAGDIVSPERWRDATVLHPSQLPIRLHADLFEPPIYRCGIAAMLSRCRHLSLDGVDSRILSPSDSLLHVCGHASYSPGRRSLRWVADAWFLISRTPNFDWDCLIRASTESKLSLPLCVMLDYLRRELDVEIPEDVLGSLARSASHLGLAAREAALLGVIDNYGQARASTHTWRSRAFLLRWRVLPTPSFLRQVHSIGSRGELLRTYARRAIRGAARQCSFGLGSSRVRIARRRFRQGHGLRDRVSGSCRRPWEPTTRQELLLKAAVLHDQRAIDAWTAWTSAGGEGQIEDGSPPLLPILYRNLSDLGVRGDPRLEPARLSYQMTWLTNQKLLRSLSSLLRSFRAAGIEVMLLKGVALALLYYRDVGLRSLGDVDLLVHPGDVQQAIDLLAETGWHPTGHVPRTLTETYLGARRAIHFGSREIEKLDLHWHVMMECCRPRGDEAFWTGAIPTEISGTEAVAMNPTDQLLHTCAHEASWTPVPLPRWIADVVAILETPDVRIDWDRLISHTRSLGLVIPVREALDCARSTADVPIPESVLEEFHAAPISRRSRKDYEARCKPPGHNPLRRVAQEYRRMCLLSEKPQPYLRFWGFPTYVRTLWGLESLWLLPIHGLRWAAGFAGRIVRHITAGPMPRC